MNSHSGVVAFPGAGSFGSEFGPLLRELKPTAWLARYPGRFGRDFGTAAGSFEELVLACATQVTCRKLVRPVLLGHSFGAYVAYATAARLQKDGAELSALVVVGATAPELFTIPEVATRSRSGTAAYLDDIDPVLVPGESSSDWRDVVVDMAYQDLRLLGGFDSADYEMLRCPIFAVRGEEDPLTSDAGIAEWAENTSDTCSRLVFPGGHSDFLGSAEFVSWVARGITTPPVIGIHQ